MTETLLKELCFLCTPAFLFCSFDPELFFPPTTILHPTISFMFRNTPPWPCWSFITNEVWQKDRLLRTSMPKCCLLSEISVAGCMPTVDQLCFISPAWCCVLCSQAAPGDFGSRLDTSSPLWRTSSSYSIPSSLAESKIWGWNGTLSDIFSMHSDPCVLVHFRNTDWPPR